MSSTNGHKYSFDGFVVDPANRELIRDGVPIPLQGKVFDVLLALAENPDRLLSKEELIKAVWNDDFVEEGNLARHISTLRKALGDAGRDHLYIKTVQGKGYRFIAPVSVNANGSLPALETPAETPEIASLFQHSDDNLSQKSHPTASPISSASARWVFVLAGLAILATATVISTQRFFSPRPIRSIAVLPFKRLDGDNNYVGIGIADAVIRKITQTGQMTVRPTSSILHYANQDIDTLTAGRELNVEAVLEGNLQNSGGRIRVSVNLFRLSDGTSMWTDNFDMSAEDIFAVQDKVAQNVAERLRLHLQPVTVSDNRQRYPANQTAYELYLKGVFSLGERSHAMPQMQTTIDLFKKSIDADPDYAQSHAQLATAYVWTALFIEPNEPKWASMARDEIAVAERLNPDIAETHLAKALLFWSNYENFRNDDAIREVIAARKLDPNSTHGELVGILGHLGLDDYAENELARSREIDPTNRSLDDLTLILPYLRGDADGWFAEWQKNNSGSSPVVDVWYLLRKGRMEEAKKVLDINDDGPDGPNKMSYRALYLAQTGNFQEAEELVPVFIARIDQHDNQLHHLTYNAACIYALNGNAAESVKWLRKTANSGFPNYPLFERDPYLDRIRQTPEFVQFIDEQKQQWERFKQEVDE